MNNFTKLNNQQITEDFGTTETQKDDLRKDPDLSLLPQSIKNEISIYEENDNRMNCILAMFRKSRHSLKTNQTHLHSAVLFLIRSVEYDTELISKTLPRFDLYSMTIVNVF